MSRRILVLSASVGAGHLRAAEAVELALRQLDDAHKKPKAKCPFVPQREMVKKLWGTDADPLAHKGEWEQRLAQGGKPAPFSLDHSD